MKKFLTIMSIVCIGLGLLSAMYSSMKLAEGENASEGAIRRDTTTGMEFTVRSEETRRGEGAMQTALILIGVGAVFFVASRTVKRRT